MPSGTAQTWSNVDDNVMASCHFSDRGRVVGPGSGQGMGPKWADGTSGDGEIPNQYFVRLRAIAF